MLRKDYKKIIRNAAWRVNPQTGRREFYETGDRIVYGKVWGWAHWGNGLQFDPGDDSEYEELKSPSRLNKEELKKRIYGIGQLTFRSNLNQPFFSKSFLENVVKPKVHDCNLRRVNITPNKAEFPTENYRYRIGQKFHGGDLSTRDGADAFIVAVAKENLEETLAWLDDYIFELTPFEAEHFVGGDGQPCIWNSIMYSFKAIVPTDQDTTDQTPGP